MWVRNLDRWEGACGWLWAEHVNAVRVVTRVEVWVRC